MHILPWWRKKTNKYKPEFPWLSRRNQRLAKSVNSPLTQTYSDDRDKELIESMAPCNIEENGTRSSCDRRLPTLSAAIATAATLSENGETDSSVGDQSSVTQLTDNNSVTTEISSPNALGDKIDNGELRDLVDRRPRSRSYGVPDGLVMDPLTPSALAVSNEFMERIGSGLTLLRDHGKKVQKYVLKNRKFDILKKSWNSVMHVVLIEAKDLPEVPANGSNGLYCKFKIGSESHKSKLVPARTKPTWCERFNIYLYDSKYLEALVWHKGKQKNFMGRCLIDISKLEREKTHDIWQELECGFGSIHLLVTISGSARRTDHIPTTNGVHHNPLQHEDFPWYRFDNWSQVGQLSVTVHSAKGLSAFGISGKTDAYCVLELDNSRVQTHTVRGTSDPRWGKTYYFTVNDITSTLDITVYDESLIASKRAETLGALSIPLLRITNDEVKWFALKDRSKKTSAKGNCPRILLQLSVVWNPIKASMRVLSPKEKNYMQKPAKFNIPLIYSNLKFIKDVFNAAFVGNEHFKRVLEWENRQRSAVALALWLVFWYFFRLWMAPLLLVLPFLYHWAGQQYYAKNNVIVPTSIYKTDVDVSDEELETPKDENSIKMRLYGLQDLTFTIKNGIDYIVSLLERINNLTNFTVPYLSYLAIGVLLIASFALSFIPVNYLFMAFGIYKFARKIVNPNRVPNNDILDFLSRVPDNEILQWRELKVPEPNLSRAGSTKRREINGELTLNTLQIEL
ncbi:multiple C2 and transmembrane domain-containing protein-like isoform X2 [Plodia interpunctella]|uniref:multiple C2 and transmembrane domain-containing protein-like isoform X2 n=1 Tax=Plodia interpunctella TaxID=58824 RepID=UPI002368832C|nr:multiple C2 and transmembrane domain-containing protein-like isoform X2 [Plodia interpunctella]